jgi:hypothetical protein
MMNSIDNINQTHKYLKAVLKKAGYKVKDTATEKNHKLKIYVLGKTLDIQWRNQINRAVLFNLLNTANKSDEYIPVIATGKLTKAIFEYCREKGFSVIDTYGNGCINIPGFWYERFIVQDQKKRIPVSGTPFSKKASRLVRAFLAEPARKWTQADLIVATGFTQGYASKCLKVLFQKGYIGGSGGFIQLREPDKLLDDWASHYRFDRHIQTRYAFAYSTYEVGLDMLGEALTRAGLNYAYTGWSGAHLRAAFAIPPSIMAYVLQVPEKPEDIGLYPVEHGENCILIKPQDEGILQFSQGINGLKVVCDPQLYLDLRKMPGRALEQAEVIRKKLLNWENIVYE